MDFSPSLSDVTHLFVIPAKAGMQGLYEVWITAFARMTVFGLDFKGFSVPTYTRALSVHRLFIKNKPACAEDVFLAWGSAS